MDEPLPLPDQPTLPTIHELELQCLGDQTYKALVTRDQMLLNRVRRLEKIIESTHE